MANKAISELPQAQNVNNQDLFVLEQGGLAKKLTAETFITEQGIIDALAEALDGHGGISSVTLSSVSGRIRTYLITFTDQSTTTFQVLDGNTIDRIAKTSTAGSVDTYTIFMSDGTTSFFQVTNGGYGLDRTLTMSNAAAPADLVGDLKSAINPYNTFKEVAESGTSGLKRFAGYEVRNVKEPGIVTQTQNAHADPYYSVNSTVDHYSTVNYKKLPQTKEAFNYLPSEEIDFTPSEGFVRIVVGKNSDDVFFIDHEASEATGTFGNPSRDALEITSDFVNFQTVLKSDVVVNPDLVNPTDWQVGVNWIGGSATDRAVIYVPVTSGQSYDMKIPSVSWATNVTLIQKDGNQGSSSKIDATTHYNGTWDTVTALSGVTYFCFQINGNTTITQAMIDDYQLSIALHDTRSGIRLANMTNIKVKSVKQFSNGTYLLAISCKDIRDNSNKTHFYKMSADMAYIAHCTYNDYNNVSHEMTDEFMGNVYDWHIFIYDRFGIATTYGNRNPSTDLGRVWFTQNGGSTWKQVFQMTNHYQDGQAQGVTVTQTHIHGVMLDPYANRGVPRMFVIAGEDSSNIFWSDDGVDADDSSWQVIDIRNQPCYDFNWYNQVVNGYPFNDGLIFGSDIYGVGAIFRINKLDGGAYSRIEPAHEFLPNYYSTPTSYCAAGLYKRDMNAPLLMCETRENHQDTEAKNEQLNQQHLARIVATYDGYNFTEVWKDDTYGSHTVKINGASVNRNFAYCTRGMIAYLLKNNDVIIVYSGRDFYYFGSEELYGQKGLSNGCCKVKRIKNAGAYL